MTTKRVRRQPRDWDAYIDRWLEEQRRIRERQAARLPRRLAIELALITVIAVIFQIYAWLFWAYLATVAAGYLGLTSRRRP